MSKKLVWDQVGQKTYETGVKNGVFYAMDNSGAYPKGVAWNGLTKVSEKPTGAETTDLFADDAKYLSLQSAEKFEASVEAYTYPDEFAECDGSANITEGVSIGQQSRKTFGMSYVTTVGNDIQNNSYGYKIHLIYGALASPSEKGYATINDSPEAITFSWELKTTPVAVSGFKPTASLVIDSTKVSEAGMKAIEDVLYGTESTEARLPLPDEVKSIIESAA